MPGKTIEELIKKMDPEKALREIAQAVKTLFPLLDQESRLNFVVSLIGDAGADKVASLVNLWLAECLDEGVDPTKMCQTLVDKIFQSKQLRTVAEPDILVLFEDWLEELEEEIIKKVQKSGSRDLGELARRLGLSRAGVNFLITKLKREDRIWRKEKEMLTVHCFYNEPPGKTWKHFQEMMSRLGQKYVMAIVATSKSREEYNSEEYARANLPVAPAIRIDSETIVERSDILEDKLENALRAKLGLDPHGK